MFAIHLSQINSSVFIIIGVEGSATLKNKIRNSFQISALLSAS